jgi:hypothetical protein
MSAWAMAGALLDRFGQRVADASGLDEPLAEEMLAFARGARDELDALADALAVEVAESMVASGFARILRCGPYAHIAARLPESDAESESGLL